MSRNRWVISDTHFGHKNILKFTKPDGSPIRPGIRNEDATLTVFTDIQHHDELLIQRWNERVKPDDVVYHLGDFGHPLEICSRLNGKKRLILGNHDDIHQMSAIGKYFESVTSQVVFKNEFGYPTLFHHVPVHATEVFPAVRRINVHGHIHEKKICKRNGMVDHWYVNVCVEHTNHAPIAWEDLAKEIEFRIGRLKSLGEME